MCAGSRCPRGSGWWTGSSIWPPSQGLRWAPQLSRTFRRMERTSASCIFSRRLRRGVRCSAPIFASSGGEPHRAFARGACRPWPALGGGAASSGVWGGTRMMPRSIRRARSPLTRARLSLSAPPKQANRPGGPLETALRLRRDGAANYRTGTGGED